MTLRKTGLAAGLLAFAGFVHAETIDVFADGEPVATVKIPEHAKFRVMANEIHVSDDGALTTYIGNVHVETNLNGSMISLQGSEAVVIK